MKRITIYDYEEVTCMWDTDKETDLFLNEYVDKYFSRISYNRKSYFIRKEKLKMKRVVEKWEVRGVHGKKFGRLNEAKAYAKCCSCLEEYDYECNLVLVKDGYTQIEYKNGVMVSARLSKFYK